MFHLKCFTCMMCRKELSTGEELYILDENRFICKEDYISSKLSGKIVKFNMSRVMRKLVFGVSDQVRHKPGYTARGRLEACYLGSRGIVLSIYSETKGDLCICFRICKNQIFSCFGSFL